MLLPRYAPRSTPIKPPSAGAFDEPCVGTCINTEWASHIIGLMEALQWEDAWEGTQAEKQFALDQMTEIVDAMSCRCKSGIGTLAIRLGIDAQIADTNVDDFNTGGLTELHPDIPDITFDASTVDTTDEEKARRELALCWAVNDYVFSIQEKGLLQGAEIDTALTVFTLATTPQFGPILGLIFTNITNTILFAANRAIDNQAAGLKVICCMIDGLKGQLVTEANFVTALDNCPDITGIQESAIKNLVRNSLQVQENFLAFIKALGSYMSVTDNLSKCPCDPVEVCDFSIGKCGFEAFNDGTVSWAVYIQDSGWNNSASGALNHIIWITRTLTEDTAFKAIEFNRPTDGDTSFQMRWSYDLLDEFGVSLQSGQTEVGNEIVSSRWIFPEVQGVREVRLKLERLGIQFGVPGMIVAAEAVAEPPPFPLQLP